MLLFDASNTEQIVTVTLSEKVTISDPFYHFVFKHTETKAVVEKVYSYAEDLSPFEERFNHFVIDCSEAFSNKPDGQWLYEVYESDNEETKAGLLETGKMQLVMARATVFTKYESTTSFKAYNGQ